jgi:predicted DCC family thiol-disulfide oxidoreductase YuxK
VKSLRDHFLRIDARSLGLFRVAFGLVLLGDLFARWRWARDFYSNEGVLPNHNHLFNLHGKQQVFSVFHAFSTPGEAHFAFAVTLVVYLFFLVGHATRVVHVLSAVLLVSLTSRNILLENAGNHAAIALLLFTAFLPCGSRFSLDSLRASLARTDEKRAAELNERAPPAETEVAARRLPGWSPVSLAALAVLLQIAVIYLCSALQQRGEAWRDGSALHYALHVDRWVSGAGVWARDALPAGTLRALTLGFRGVELAIPALLVVPVFFRWTRGLAAALMAAHGLLLGLLFDFGLFGWTMVAAAALVLPGELWDALERTPVGRRARTIVYDADCGVCLWLARLVKRADLRGNLTFQGNDDLGELLVRGPDGATARAPMPKEVTPELVEHTVLAIDRGGRVFTRGRAVVLVLRALPFGWLALPLLVPGISHALDALYGVIAPRRQRISVLMGKQACGIPLPPEGDASGQAPSEAPPAVRVARLASGSVREAAALVVLAAMLTQTAKENPLPGGLSSLPQGRVLAAVASWPRMLSRWDLLAPEPPRKNATMVVNAQTRASQAIDLLTNGEPQLDLAVRGRVGLGQLWSDYLDRVHQKEWQDYQRAFREYLARGGPYRDKAAAPVTGLDAYWVARAIPAPGQPAPGEGEIEKEKVFTHARGGGDKVDLGRMPVPQFGSGKLRPGK